MASTISAGTTSGTAIAIAGDTSGQLQLLTNNGTAAVTIDTAQNVYIGTTSGSTYYDKNVLIYGTNSSVLKTCNGTTGTGVNDGLDIGQLDPSNRSDAYIFQRESAPMLFGTANTEQMRLTAAGLLQFNSGYGSVATAYGCRAWVNFNGTGTVAIRASGNVSSITDNGTGDYTVNFTTSMPDANYSVSGTCVGSSTNAFSVICGAGGSALATGSVRFGVIVSTAGTNQDYSFISIQIFR